MKIGIIGGGAMGSGLALGLARSGKTGGEEIMVSNPHIEKIAKLEDLGIRITTSNREAAKNADLIVLAVKPWIVERVVKEIADETDREGTEFCSLAAGISGDELQSMFPSGTPRHLTLAMPNTAMAVGESMTFLVCRHGTPLHSKRIFGLVGRVMEIEERQLTGAMALASCGIAYAMRYIRAACEGGVELGLRAGEAQEIMAQTLQGAVALLRQPGAHPETEIDKVTTPGGITIRGLNAMEEAGFTAAVIAGLRASK